MIPINEYVNTLVNARRYEIIVNEVNNNVVNLDEFRKKCEKMSTDDLLKLKQKIEENMSIRDNLIELNKKMNESIINNDGKKAIIYAKEFRNKVEKINSSVISNEMKKELDKATREFENSINSENKGNIKKIIRIILSAIGGGALGGALGYIISKKIADKKKAAKEKEEEVKENYEYPEYNDLLECITNSLTEEELMSENAAELVLEVADYLIENC